MKSLKPALLIFLLTFMALLPLTSSLKPLRHVNPIEVPEESLLPSGLLTFYFSVIDLSTLKRYDEALEELGKAHLLYMPGNLRFITSRFNELLADASDKLKRVEYHIVKAEDLIDAAKLEDAGAEVREASRLLGETEEAISNLESSSVQLANLLKVRPEPLLDRIGKLEALAEAYAKRIEELSRIIEELTPRPGKLLTRPELTIQLSASEAWVGGRLIVNGSLKALGKGLSGKVVRVYFEGAEAGRASTDENGTYLIEVQIPYIYKPFATIFSAYTPLKGEVYAPCSSNTLTLKLLYYRPELSISPVPKALPGRNLTIHGSLSLRDKPIKGHVVRLHAFDESSSTLTDGSGSFRFEIAVPSSVPVGAWPATVEVPSRGIMAPAFGLLTIYVEKIQTGISVEAPKIAFSGSKITFKVRISLEGMENSTVGGGDEASLWREAIEDSMVIVKVGEWTGIRQGASGGPFNVEVYVPLNSLTGNYAYTISIEPNRPWLYPASTGGSIRILSPLTLTMPVLAILAAALTIRRPKPKEEKSIGAPQAIVEEVLPQPTEGLASLYWNAVRMITDRTGVYMEDGYTIREYLHAVADKLNEGLAPFERLSLAYEKILYARWISLREEDEARSAYFKLQSLYEGRKILPESIFCIYCGEKMPPEANYCDKCGRPLYKGDL